MEPRPSKEEIFARLFGEAINRWGEEMVHEIQSEIERASESIWQVKEFEIEPENKPSRPLGRA